VQTKLGSFLCLGPVSLESFGPRYFGRRWTPGAGIRGRGPGVFKNCPLGGAHRNSGGVPKFKGGSRWKGLNFVACAPGFPIFAQKRVSISADTWRRRSPHRGKRGGGEGPGGKARGGKRPPGFWGGTRLVGPREGGANIWERRPLC